MNRPRRPRVNGRLKALLLAEALPGLAQEIEQLLVKDEESDLAEQVSALKIVDRCRCGDDFCGSFRTGPEPNGSYGPSHRNVVLDSNQGMLILDVVEERIVYVEVLYRDDIRDAIGRIVP